MREKASLLQQLLIYWLDCGEENERGLADWFFHTITVT